MTTLERPRLRPLSFARVRHDGEDYVACQDPSGSFAGQILIPSPLFRSVVRLCDGGSSQDEIRARVARKAGVILSADEMRTLVARLDEALVLDGPMFRSFLAAYHAETVRPAALAGRSYPAEPGALRATLARFFADRHGSGPVASIGPAEGMARLRAILCPHIDFTRGGPTYTWAYRELVERSDADTFVILGVAHHPCRRRFALTRKDFATPLGMVETDREFVDRVAAMIGPGPFDDELAHRNEHSIEFQAVFLQYLLAGLRPFRIVPILVGSFHDLMAPGRDPIDDPEVAAMVAALRDAEQACGRKVAYIGGIDLCHVGPDFGDPAPVDDATLGRVRAFDRGMLDHAEAGDARGWFDHAARVDNRWRVCGLAAAYTMLRAIDPARGRLLRYDQAVDPARACCVSFASVAYESTKGRGASK